ncbi:MAG: circularly permuted type 2 ATP-grasp protein [Solirubrobacterales bacterium]
MGPINLTSQLSSATSGLGGYRPAEGYFDEAFDASGAVRTHYADLAELIGALDPAALARAAQEHVDSDGVSFTTKSGTLPFVVDPMPRVISAAEWNPLGAGVAQRVAALNRFVQDVYGDREIVKAGIVPWSAIESAEYFEPDLVGTSPPAGIFTHLAGLDLVRDADGRLRVLEDNVRSPSGLTFSLAARRMSESILPFAGDFDKLAVDDVSVFGAMSDVLHAAAPTDNGEPAIALVSDGPKSAAWYEHRQVAKALDIYLFSIEQLESHGGSIYGRDSDGLLKPIDVIYRRTDLDMLRSPRGALTHFGELLLDPIRNGAVASVNAFGSGIADDKLIHAYVEEMIGFYLDEEPLLRSVKTYDPSDAQTLAMIEERAGELVIKPRGGLGGSDVTIGPKSSREEIDTALARVQAEPNLWVAQETVALSTHPTVAENCWQPRHIDLRPYAIHLADGAQTLPACLTRVALSKGGLIVNSSRNGGAKDTWITAG